MSNEKLKAQANQIASIIQSVDTDFRGELFLEVSKSLSVLGQHCTSRIIKEAADSYGYRDEGH